MIFFLPAATVENSFKILSLTSVSKKKKDRGEECYFLRLVLYPKLSLRYVLEDFVFT